MKIRFDLITLLLVQARHKFAHVTTAELSWHVRNCGLLASLIVAMKSNMIFTRFWQRTHKPFLRMVTYMHIYIYIYLYTYIHTLLAKKVVTPPLKTIKPMWIELLYFHLAEIGMIWTRDCSPTKPDTTLGRHSMQGQVGSSSSETTV